MVMKFDRVTQKMFLGAVEITLHEWSASEHSGVRAFPDVFVQHTEMSSVIIYASFYGAVGVE